MIQSNSQSLHNLNLKVKGLGQGENKENCNSNVQQVIHHKQFPRASKNSVLGMGYQSNTTTSSEPQDINWEQDLKTQFTNNIKQTYSQDILDCLMSRSMEGEAFLGKHAITPHLRSKMVDWMIEVLSSYKMSEESFFKSVKFMDEFFQNTERKMQVSDLHLVGVGAMFTATKFEQIYPLKLNAMYDKICRKKFSKKQILDMEESILSGMNFQLNQVTVYQLAKHLTVTLTLNFTESVRKYFEDVVLYLCKMILHSYELSQEDECSLAGAIVYLGLKTVEQVEAFAADEYIMDLAQKCQISGQRILELGSVILNQAKNFKNFYPNLNNLKKFNNVKYNNH